MAVLRNYEGEEFLHEVCKELVRVVSDGERLLTEVRITLLMRAPVSLVVRTVLWRLINAK